MSLNSAVAYLKQTLKTQEALVAASVQRLEDAPDNPLPLYELGLQHQTLQDAYDALSLAAQRIIDEYGLIEDEETE